MSDSDFKPAAGWYGDPVGDVRWWDGHQWTDEVRLETLRKAAGPRLGWLGWLLLAGFAAAAIWAGQLLWVTD